MATFRRFEPTLTNAPGEIRVMLRDRLSRNLPPWPRNRLPPAKGGSKILPDEQFLELLANVQITHERDVERARRSYEATRSSDSEEPSFDDLIESGWLRIVWGRITLPSPVRSVTRNWEKKLPGLADLATKQFSRQFYIPDSASTSVALNDVVADINGGRTTPEDYGCSDVIWIAARLWDRHYANFTDPETAIRDWVDRWLLLGTPSFTPMDVWQDEVAEKFRQAALNAIASEQSLLGWEKTRALFIKQMAIMSDQSEGIVAVHIPAIPETNFERTDWLHYPSIERAQHTFGEFDAPFGLLGLLLADVEAMTGGVAPNPLAKSIIDLALDRPELMFNLQMRMQYKALLLADFLMHPATSALACQLVTKWHGAHGAWERELREADDRAVKTAAFADAAAVAGHYLEKGSMQPEEAAALLNWLFQSGSPEHESYLAIFRDEMTKLPQEVLERMVASLLRSEPDSNHKTSIFLAILDIVEAGKLVSAISPQPLISAYVTWLSAEQNRFSTDRVTTAGAATLYALATRLSPSELQTFLRPIDVYERLNAVGEENSYVATNAIADSIRDHIRVLCRAIAGQKDGVPNELANSLVFAVRRGAIDHPQKGRVPALSAQSEVDRWRDRHAPSIALDLGRAYSALNAEHQDELLSAILETDEPLVLAKLLGFMPHSARSPIAKRIKALTPSEAAWIYTLPEAQGRAEALLAAGLPDAAELYIEEEKNMRTMGYVRGREAAQYRMRLWLLFLRERWQEIRDATVPPELSQEEKQQANGSYSFFRALTELAAPNGNLKLAENTFSRLQAQQPKTHAYANDLFAAQLKKLLREDRFPRLQGDDQRQGRQLLTEADEMMLSAPAVTAEDKAIFGCNKAMLLLAVGNPREALQLLEGLPDSQLQDRIAAYSAVALVRLNRDQEARATINEALGEFGETDALKAALAEIGGSGPIAAEVGVSLGGTIWPMNETWEILPEEIKEFSLMKGVEVKDANEWMVAMKNIPEAHVKEAIAALLKEPSKADWGGEENDHFSANVHFAERRRTAAFLLKGPTKFREMVPAMCGQNGDQINRLVKTGAEISIVQHAHLIGPAVRELLRSMVVTSGEPRKFCLIDGQATYRLLKAYGHLPSG